MSLTLVTNNTCPYAMRIIAALNYLKLPYEIKYIDLENKPDWFLTSSPLEKVPILFVGEKVLSESLVILEYINTLSPQSLLPVDNLERALNRARAEFSSEIISTLIGLLQTKNEESFNNKLTDLKWYFQKLEVWLQQTKFIYNNEITLADFSYAPIFALISSMKPILKFNLYEGFPRLLEYAQTLLSLPEVQAIEIAENYFKAHNQMRQLSKIKKSEKLEPLSCKQGDVNAWRLSKRKG